jgi:N-acetyl-anhydromuramyl-L-alanine amidase AmpD
MSIELKSLISKLLERNLQRRLGVKDISDIKQHDFFKKFDWKKLESKKLDVPSEMFANR